MRNTFIILLAVLICCGDHAHSQQLTSVRFLSLRNLLNSVMGFLDNLHRRSLNLNVKEKPSYKPNPSYVKKPNVLLNSQAGEMKKNVKIYILNHSNSNPVLGDNIGFQPISPPPTYQPVPASIVTKAPLAHIAPPAPLPLPSYLNYWSYFPLGRITPINIETGIKAATEDVYHDGKNQITEVNLR